MWGGPIPWPLSGGVWPFLGNSIALWHTCDKVDNFKLSIKLELSLNLYFYYVEKMR